jgi:N utilization substance protein B
MTRRSRAREVALQLLFQRDVNPGVSRQAIEQFVHERLRDSNLGAFCLRLHDGVVGNLVAIDAKLTAAADNWRLVRMMCVDRNVLRIGTFELLYAANETPAAVALDEAITLSRRYGSKDSAAFVNGVLDKINHSRDQMPATSKTDQAPAAAAVQPDES